MKRTVSALSAMLMALVVLAPAAMAHVTIQPNEAVSGSFARFVVRVPNESEEASTIRVKLSLPPLASVRFEPKDGWKRKVKMTEFDEPIEAFDQEITEGVGSVTWSGGKIRPGEFLEFGFSAAMPDGEETITFQAIQTYDDGEVARWVGAPDSESPAPEVHTYDIGAGEGEGQLAVLAALRDQVGAVDEAPEEDSTTTGDDAEDDDDQSPLPTILSIVAVVLALAALAVAMSKKATPAR